MSRLQFKDFLAKDKDAVSAKELKTEPTEPVASGSQDVVAKTEPEYNTPDHLDTLPLKAKPKRKSTTPRSSLPAKKYKFQLADGH